MEGEAELVHHAFLLVVPEAGEGLASSPAEAAGVRVRRAFPPAVPGAEEEPESSPVAGEAGPGHHAFLQVVPEGPETLLEAEGAV